MSVDLERDGARALLATYVQMASYAQLARALQKTRERTIERRLEAATAVEDIYRLQQQLDAQQSQGATLEDAAERFNVDSSHLVRFGEAGLDYQDFEDLGLGDVVTPEAIQAARAERQREEAAQTPETQGTGAPGSTSEP